LPIFGNILSSLRYDANRIVNLVAANQAETYRINQSIINGEAQAYQRREQAITQTGQQIEMMQTQLAQTFQTQNYVTGQNRIAALGGFAPFHDGDGNPLYAPLGATTGQAVGLNTASPTASFLVAAGSQSHRITDQTCCPRTVACPVVSRVLFTEVRDERSR
jgi:hypothetical protein